MKYMITIQRIAVALAALVFAMLIQEDVKGSPTWIIAPIALGAFLFVEVFTGMGVAMNLTAGFVKTCVARSGGLVEVFLANRDDVDTFTLSGGVYTVANMVGSGVFHKFEFDQDSANLLETATRENRSLKIDHIIEFFLGKLDQVMRDRMQEIADASNCGMIAIVKDANGLFWVVGYSEKQLKERPLELQTGAGDTGKAFTDPSGTTVTIQSTDNEYSRTFTGTVPV